MFAFPRRKGKQSFLGRLSFFFYCQLLFVLGQICASVNAIEFKVEDLLSFDTPNSDQTLCVEETVLERVFSDPGFSASSLIHEVVKFASSISTCRAVYLHVISYNIPAIHLYKKMSFQCLRRLYNFYYINGQHYDSYLFVYYVNGGRSPCSPLELVLLFVSYIKGGFKSIAAKLWKNEERKKFKWPKFKESSCLLPTVQNKRIATSESARSVPACGIS
ncbi:histone acetyltransferase MCC1-like isoform X3 [Primulina huaijiensis]|uniref:histone acetyltransferase MCC1-like isoform X3 n=1 Tax=Primulina huaijiensis TaxID=1492673 RepID=UPI003CC73815